ncbi:MAG: AglZ/HisF2 family acetamidino modification protein [Burkholderiaceae bacterium]|nr:AglZ/HisF2 family acetamidino modification protein [Burkholderiaceae bacterium]
MLRPRIIPCLLVHKGGLVKTVGFDKPKYVGDPLNAVRIFNEKEVDELMVLDIDATRQRRDPDYALIRNLAAECRMPLAYGGGVHSVEQFERLVSLGVEKVAVSAAAVADPALLGAAAARVGRQSVVVVLDVRRGAGGWQVFTHNGQRATGLDAAAFARQAEAAGAGEIVVNSIDRDGQMKGYDLDLVRQVRTAVTVPLTVLGGAGSLADIGTLVREFGIVGAAAGSLFVFKGVYRAVLINYPARADKDKLIAAASGAPA